MNTIQLQGIGKVKATVASELKINDTVVWNYGESTIVKNIEKVGKNSLKVTFKTKRGNWTKTIRNTTKLAIR